MSVINCKIVVDKKELFESFLEEDTFNEDAAYICSNYPPASIISNLYYSTVKNILNKHFNKNIDIHYNGDVNSKLVKKTNQKVVCNIWADWIGFKKEWFNGSLKQEIISELIKNKLIKKVSVSIGSPNIDEQLQRSYDMLINLGANPEEATKITKEVSAFTKFQGW